MRLFLFVFLCCAVFSAEAQVGRFEEPVDTIPIGGDIQQKKSTQMEAQDQLTNNLAALRDSVHMINSSSLASERRRELDEMIEGLKSTERAPGLMKKGYVLLNDVRAEIKGTKKASE